MKLKDAFHDKKEKDKKVAKTTSTPGQTEITTKKVTTKKDIILWVVMSFTLVIWLISFIRVPYVGTFLDSVLFEFTIGWAKYPLYLLLLMYILCIKVDKLKKIFCVEKRVLWFLAPILIIVIIMNTVDCYLKGYNVLMAKELYIGSDGYITNWLTLYWKDTVVNFNVSYLDSWIPKSYAYGGIIGLVIVFTTSYFSPILLIIILITLSVIFGLIYYNKKYKNKKPKEIIENMFKDDESKKSKEQANI